MSETLTDNEVRILSLIEQRFWELGVIPTNEKVALDLKTTTQAVKKAWDKPYFRKAIAARGVDLDSTVTEGVLTPTQVVFANMLLNVHDKSSVREKLQAISTATGQSVTTQTYNTWLAQPAFSSYLRKRAEKTFAAHDFAAYNTLVSAIEGGDVNATMKFFEMRGIYSPRMEVSVNIEQVVVNLVEIVSRHVTDPSILEAIAVDIERLDLFNKGSQAALQALPVEVLSPSSGISL